MAIKPRLNGDQEASKEGR